MPDERQKRKSALPLAIVLAILFRLFLLAEDTVEKRFTIPVPSAGEGAPGGGVLPESAQVTLEGKRIVLLLLRQDAVSLRRGPGGVLDIGVPRGTRMVRVETRSSAPVLP